MNWSLNQEDPNIAFFINNQIDSRFVGVWKGTDHGKFFKGETNSWVINRKADGTLMIHFKTINSDESETYSEEVGYWCVKGDEYFEYRESDDKKDQYSFIFLSNDLVHFIINESEEREEPYNFIDYKVILD